MDDTPEIVTFLSGSVSEGGSRRGAGDDGREGKRKSDAGGICLPLMGAGRKEGGREGGMGPH